MEIVSEYTSGHQDAIGDNKADERAQDLERRIARTQQQIDRTTVHFSRAQLAYPPREADEAEDEYYDEARAASFLLPRLRGSRATARAGEHRRVGGTSRART